MALPLWCPLVTNPRVLVAGRTILPSILNGLASIANPSDPLKFTYQAISYKPFISLFNMTGIAEMNPELAGIGKALNVILHYPIFLTSSHPSKLRCGHCVRSPPISWGAAGLEVQL